MPDSLRSPIMLCSSPRSGSTWVEQIFDSHPATFTLHEPDRGYLREGFVDDRFPLYASIEQSEALGDSAREFIAKMLKRRSVDVVGKAPHFSKRYMSGAAFALRKAAITLVKGASQAAVLRGKEGLSIPDLSPLARDPRVRMVWKSISLTGCLGFLAKSQPDMSEVLIMRHPCGQISSMLRGSAQGKFETGITGNWKRLLKTDQAKQHGLTLDGIRSLDVVDQLAWQWVIEHEKATKDISGHDKAMILIYEELCASPDTKAKEMLAFCGLDWDTQVADFVRRSTTSNNDQYYSVFKDPLMAAGKWRQQLTPDQIDRIFRILAQSTLGPYVEAMAAALENA